MGRLDLYRLQSAASGSQAGMNHSLDDAPPLPSTPVKIGHFFQFQTKCGEKSHKSSAGYIGVCPSDTKPLVHFSLGKEHSSHLLQGGIRPAQPRSVQRIFGPKRADGFGCTVTS